MSDSDLKKILEEIAEKTGGKIWVARRIGKRISYINDLKAGKELYIPYEVIYDDGEYVIFAEGVNTNEWVRKKITKLITRLKGR